MTTTGSPRPRVPVRPVRRTVLLGTLALVVGALVLAIAGVDLLRHPPAGGEPLVAEVDADPRLPVDCPDPDLLPALAEVSSNALYDCPGVYDGQPVRYTGEVVGAVLRRGDHAWVHLNDDVYSGARGPLPAHRDFQGGNGGVGVRIPAALADVIGTVGGPTARGDLLVVDGTFHRVHAASREPAVIVASTGGISVLGQPFVDPVLPERAVVAVLLAVFALALAITERVVARRRR